MLSEVWLFRHRQNADLEAASSLSLTSTACQAFHQRRRHIALHWLPHREIDAAGNGQRGRVTGKPFEKNTCRGILSQKYAYLRRRSGRGESLLKILKLRRREALTFCDRYDNVEESREISIDGIDRRSLSTVLKVVYDRRVQIIRRCNDQSAAGDDRHQPTAPHIRTDLPMM